MATQPLSDNTLRDAWDRVKQIGTLAGAAREGGIARATLENQMQRAMERFGLPDPRTPAPPQFRSPTASAAPSRSPESLRTAIHAALKNNRRNLDDLASHLGSSAGAVLDAIEVLQTEREGDGVWGRCCD